MTRLLVTHARTHKLHARTRNNHKECSKTELTAMCNWQKKTILHFITKKFAYVRKK